MPFQKFSGSSLNRNRNMSLCLLLRVLCLFAAGNTHIGKMGALRSSFDYYSAENIDYTGFENMPTDTRYPELNTSYFSELVTHPEKHLESNCCYTKLSAFNLYECSCPGNHGAHNRFLKGNTRTKIEDLIIEHISKRLPKEPVKILSLGSGECLQDLMVVARLVNEDIRSVDIVLVEPNNTYIDAYKELTYLLEEMKRIYSMKINYKRFSCVDNISVEGPFDVVYAIDYDDYYPYLDCSDRNLLCRTRYFNESPYIATIDFIKAANLANPVEESLVIMSHGWDIISLAPKAAKSCLLEFRSVSQLNIDLGSIDKIYINAGIGNLILSLEYLINAKKPLLINKTIIQEKDMVSVAKFLSHHQISYEFVDDATIPERFKEEKGLVIDCTAFNRNSKETPVPPLYSESNVLVVRIDYTKSYVGNIYMDVYSSKTSNFILEHSYVFGSGIAFLAIVAIIILRSWL